MNIPGNLDLPRLIQFLQRYFNQSPVAPVPIPTYTAPANLPPATSIPPNIIASPPPGAPSGVTGLVFVTSISTLAVSNGTHWLRTDTGAVIA